MRGWTVEWDSTAQQQHYQYISACHLLSWQSGHGELLLAVPLWLCGCVRCSLPLCDWSVLSFPRAAAAFVVRSLRAAAAMSGRGGESERGATAGGSRCHYRSSRHCWYSC